MLTPSGYGVLVVGVAASVLGWGWGYREGVVLGVACLLAVVTALAWTTRRPSIQARREVVPGKVARGDSAQGRVSLTNNGGRALRGLRAEDHVARIAVPPVYLPTVGPGAEIRARYDLPTHRRGRVEIGPMDLVRGDPLGLTRRARQYGGLETLIVRPRTIALNALPAGRTHHLEGPTSDTADEGTLTFHSLREYVMGDDLRRVHWKSTARTGTMMVRRLKDVSLPQTTLVLDTNPAAYGDGLDADERGQAFEVAVDIVASIASSVTRNNFPLTVLTGGGPMPGVLGEHRRQEHWLDLLAEVWPQADHSLADAFDAVERQRGGDALIVVTGGTDTLGLQRLDRVQSGFDRALLVRVAPVPTRGAPTGTGAGATVVPHLRVSNLEEFAVAWRKEISR